MICTSVPLEFFISFASEAFSETFVNNKINELGAANG
jgi:hypothetical protein